jgi:outer membrane protein OmpA-like peptidoglycan-associated protein/ABC-type taurine transport system substrate-binding protein
MKDQVAKRNITVTVILFLCFVVVGVAFKLLIYPRIQGDLVDQTGSTSQYDHELTLRLDSFSGYAALRSSVFRDELHSRGIRMQFDDDAADYADRIAALKSGDAQFAVFTVDGFLVAGAELGEFPGTIVSVIDETFGADAIVAYKAGVPSLNSLNNGQSRFVLTPASPSEFLARVAIAEFGLDKMPHRWTDADGAEAVYKALKKGSRSEARAYVLWEPYRTQALEDPDVHVLFDTSQVSGYIVDVLVVQRAYLRDHPNVVQDVVASLLRATYQYSQQPGGLVDLIAADAKATGSALSAAQAASVVEGIRWRNTLENYAHMGLVPAEKAGGILHLEDSISNIAGVLVRTGGLPKGAVVGSETDLFYAGTLRQLMSEDFHPGKGEGQSHLGTADLKAAQTAIELPSLNQSEWGALTPVGSMQIKPIAFGRGGASLNVQSKRELEDLARRIRSLPNFYLTVRGHTRTEGDADANAQLAGARAETTANYLIERGVSSNRVRPLAVPPSGTGGSQQSVSFMLAQRSY